MLLFTLYFITVFYSIAGVKCPLDDLDVDNFAHGSINTKDGNEFEDEVVYSCDDGYMLQGNSSRKCGADKTWQGIAPSCQGMKIPS